MISLEIFIFASITGQVAFCGIDTIIFIIVECTEDHPMAALDVAEVLHAFDDHRLAVGRHMPSFEGEYPRLRSDALVRQKAFAAAAALRDSKHGAFDIVGDSSASGAADVPSNHF
jgi:hypothetical protein